MMVPAPVLAEDRHAVSLDSATRLAGDARVSFYVGLKRPEVKARKALRSLTAPTSDRYRHFPTRKRVTKKYGATSATIREVRRGVAKFGLSLQVDATGVFARVSGTAQQMKKWTGRKVRRQVEEIPGGVVTFVYTDAAWPRAAPKGVREFFGLDVRSRYGRGVAAAASANPVYDGLRSGTPLDSCLPNLSTGVNDYTYSVNQLRTAYGLDSLPKTVGRATRAAIMSQGGGFSTEALAAFGQCFGLPDVDFNRVAVPGLSGRLPWEMEGDLDTQVMRSVLPAGSRVSVVETSGYDWRDFLAWSTVFSLRPLPDVVSTSYGICERLQIKSSGAAGLLMTESVLLRLALAGTATFASSGDAGSSDCVDYTTGEGNRALAVGYPASSHYVTAVGGSRIELTPQNSRAAEVVWSGQSLAGMPEVDIAGGGGRSDLFVVPWWQQGVARGSRTVPDVSAHASPLPGWPLVTQGESSRLEVTPVGGTSAAAPFTAASFGVLGAVQRRANRPRIGPVQPMLYRLAQRSPSVFYDIRTGNNDLFSKGCCSARVGYDAAAGLGAVRYDELAVRLPPPG